MVSARCWSGKNTIRFGLRGSFADCALILEESARPSDPKAAARTNDRRLNFSTGELRESGPPATDGHYRIYLCYLNLRRCQITFSPAPGRARSVGQDFRCALFLKSLC